MNDLISRQALLDKFEQWQKNDGYSNGEWNLLVDVLNVIKSVPPSPQLGTNLAEDGTDCISRQAAIDALRTCVNCVRTANNGGWYADGRTRCPIEEHYALPKDGFCHLWEKRNVTDDDYPERRTDEE